MATGLATLKPILPPYNHEAEAMLLAKLLVDPSIAVKENLKRDHFHSTAHGEIFRSLINVLANGDTPDLVLVGQDLMRRDKLKDVGETLAFIGAEKVSSVGYEAYVRIIRQAYARRQVTLLAGSLAREAEGGDGFSGDIVEAYSDQLQNIRDEINGVYGPKAFAVMSAAELSEADLSIEFLVEDVLVSKQFGVIGAPDKHAKTSIACDMVVSLVSATRFLNHFHVPKKRNVLFMSAESGGAAILDTFQRICRARGLVFSTLTGVSVYLGVPDISNHEDLARLEATITEKEIEVIFIDPAYMALGDDLDAGNLFSVGPRIRRLLDFGQRLGVTIVMIHHTNKNIEPGEVCQRHHLTQAGWRESVRQWFLLNRTEEYEPETGTFRMLANIGGSAGHSSQWALTIEQGNMKDPQGRYWKTDVNYASVARQEAYQRQEEERERTKEERATSANLARTERVLKVVQQFPNGETKHTIKDLSGMNNSVVTQILFDLLARELIEPVMVPKNNKFFEGYKPKISHRDSVGLSGTNQDSPGVPDRWDGAGQDITPPLGGVCPSPGPPRSGVAVPERSGVNSRSPGPTDLWSHKPGANF